MANDDGAFDTDEVNARLFELISYMPETEKRDLLEVLEVIQQSKSDDRRKHPRKAPLTKMNCLMHEVVLKNSIQNISKEGAFIETVHSFGVGQKLSMAISLVGYDHPVQLIGTIVRIDSDGVAVEFDEPISDI